MNDFYSICPNNEPIGHFCGYGPVSVLIQVTGPEQDSFAGVAIPLCGSVPPFAIYSFAQLTGLLDTVCDELGLYLYLDGARLSSALAAGGASLTDLGRLCDAFDIGGTKNGALFGEAVCILNPALKPDFRYIIKQHGGMLAKGWLLGIQFEELFTDGLYFEVGEHANGLAMKLKEGISALGYAFGSDSPSNQQFPILPNRVLEKLEKDFHWEVNDRPDADHTQIRLVTSWATKPEAVEAFLTALANAKE